MDHLWYSELVIGIASLYQSYHNQAYKTISVSSAYLPASLPKIPPIKPTHIAIFSLSSGCPLQKM